MSFVIEDTKDKFHADLVGLKVRGFKFDGFPAFVESTMTKYIGVVGTITGSYEKACSVKFKNKDCFHGEDSWQYPYPEILEHLLPEETEEEKHHAIELENLKNLKKII